MVYQGHVLGYTIIVRYDSYAVHQHHVLGDIAAVIT